MHKETFHIILIFVIAVFACYGSVLAADFVWDDQFLVIENPLLRAPLYSLRVFKQDITNSNFNYTIYYRPLQILSYCLDYRVWSLSAFGFHLTSVIIHIINVILFFLFVRKLSGRTTPAFISALLFGVHPLGTSPVSYVSSRADLLLYFFSMLFLLSFINFRKDKKPVYLVYSAAFFVCALLSKEAAVILPFLALLMEITLLGGKDGIKWRYHAPNFILLASYVFFHARFFGSRYGTLFSANDPPALAAKFMNILGEYLILTVFPENSAVRRVFHESSGHWIPLLALVISITVIIYIRCKNDRKLIVFSVLFYCLALSPVLFVFDYFKVLGEQWGYLAASGVFVIQAVFIEKLLESRSKIIKSAGCIIFCAAVFYYAFITINQNKYWIDSSILSDRVLDFHKDDKVAAHYKALDAMKKGDIAYSEEIMEVYADKNSGDPKAWYIKGRMAIAGDDIDTAMASFKRAIELDPSYDNGYFGLALCGFITGDDEKGIELLEHVLELNPDNIEALIILGTAYSETGNNEKSLAIGKKAKAIDPYNYNVLVNLGTSHVKGKDVYAGATEYAEAIRLYPEKPLAYYNLAYIFYENENLAMARQYVNKCLERDPSFRPALELLVKLRDSSLD